MIEQEQTITRKYVISWKELREKLGLKGEFKHFNLWSGRSPNDLDKGVSSDVDTYEIVTEEEKKKRSDDG